MVPQHMKDFTEAVKKEAQGRWDVIAGALLPELSAALSKPGVMVFCPYHQSGNKTGAKKFRVKRDFASTGYCFCCCFTGEEGGRGVLDLYMATRSVRFPEAIEQVARVIGGMSPQDFKRTELTPARVKAMEVERQQEATSLIAGIQRIWAQTLPLDAPEALPARLYLRRRWVGSLGLPLPEVRFHPALKRNRDSEGLPPELLPAMVAIVRRPDGKVSTIHRMWVTPDGRKAPGAEPRMMYPVPSTHPVEGAAIRIDEATGPALNLCEGFETALTVRALTGLPTWSCVSRWGLEKVVIPPHVRVVTVWADRDKSGDGELSATLAVDRFRAEGRVGLLVLPPFPIPDGQKGVDWNDVATAFAKAQVAQLAMEQGSTLDAATERLNASQPMLGVSPVTNHFAVRQWRESVDAALRGIGLGSPKAKTA